MRCFSEKSGRMAILPSMYRMVAADCRAGTDAGSSVAGLAVKQHTDDRPWLMPMG